MGKLSVALGIIALCAAGAWGRFGSAAARFEPGQSGVVRPKFPQIPALSPWESAPRGERAA